MGMVIITKGQTFSHIRESHKQLRDVLSYRMSYIILRDPGCDILVLKVHAQVSDKIK
jgi:hypothetical protein